MCHYNRKLKIKISGDGFVFRNKVRLFPFGSMKSGNGRGDLLRAFFSVFRRFYFAVLRPQTIVLLKEILKSGRGG